MPNISRRRGLDCEVYWGMLGLAEETRDLLPDIQFTSMGFQYRAVIRASAVMGESLLALSQGSVFPHRKDVEIFRTPHVEDSLKSYSISWIMDIGFMRNQSRIAHISPTFPTRSPILATAVRRLWRSLKLRIFSLKFFQDISAERKFQPHSHSPFLVIFGQVI